MMSLHVKVSDFQVLHVDDEDGAGPRPVCLVTDLEAVTQQNTKFLVTTTASTRKRSQPTRHQQVEKDNGDDITFVSNASERETQSLLPVAGERSYYLPLNSDQYPLEWDARAPPTRAHRWCVNPFAPAGRIHSIKEIHALIAGAASDESAAQGRSSSFPPLIGVVRAKSKVTHFGEPGISNPFPFMFHVIVGACVCFV